MVIDDDTYYWVYLSSDHLFQVYYKVRQPFFYYKVRQLFHYKVRQVLLRATGITKCDNFITKCDDYYKAMFFCLSDFFLKLLVLFVCLLFFWFAFCCCCRFCALVFRFACAPQREVWLATSPKARQRYSLT